MFTFKNLLTSKKTDALDKIDNLNNVIEPSKNENDQDLFDKSVNNLLTDDEKDKNTPTNEIEQLLNSLEVSKDRIRRYSTYDEIVTSIPIVKKILKTYISNILIKNPVNQKLYSINRTVQNSDNNENDPKSNKSKQFIDNFIKYYDFINKLKQFILPQKLKYGDYFVEIVNPDQKLKNFDYNNVRSLLTEVNNNFDIKKENYKSESSQNLLFERLSNEFILDIDEKTSDDQSNEESNSNNLNEITFNDTILKFHKPHNIIKLKTKYEFLFGYVEVLYSDTTHSKNSQSITSLIGKIKSLNPNESNKENSENVIGKLSKHMLKKIIKNNMSDEEKRTNNIDMNNIVNSLDEDTLSTFKKLFIDNGFDQYNSKSCRMFKVRFIPTTNMVEFSNNSSEYYPYGDSIIDNLILPSKLYIISQLSNTVNKLSRSSLIRKWDIDVGKLQMQSGQIQKLKKELYNTRMTVDDLSSFKSIPKILSDYKDMFMISKNGKKAVDATVESHGDPSINVEDLEDARREIISLSGVPAPYLGYNDVVELKEQLVHSNISFATEIIDHQESITSGVQEIIEKLAKQKGLDFNPNDYYEFKLIPPTSLILQIIESTLSMVGNIVNTFQNMDMENIDPYMFLEQYVPYIDWESFRNNVDKNKHNTGIKNQLDKENNSDQESEGGGW